MPLVLTLTAVFLAACQTDSEPTEEAAPETRSLEPRPSEPDAPELTTQLKAPEARVAIRIAPRDSPIVDVDAVLSRFDEGKPELMAHEGFLAASLHHAVNEETAFRFVTLAVWASAEAATKAAPDLDSTDTSPLGLYQTIYADGIAERPATGTFTVLAPFTGSPADQARTLTHIREFAEAGKKQAGWQGVVVFGAATGEPRYSMISLTSWSSEDAARAYFASPERTEVIERLSAAEVTPVAGVSLMKVVSN